MLFMLSFLSACSVLRCAGDHKSRAKQLQQLQHDIDKLPQPVPVPLPLPQSLPERMQRVFHIKLAIWHGHQDWWLCVCMSVVHCSSWVLVTNERYECLAKCFCQLESVHLRGGNRGRGWGVGVPKEAFYLWCATFKAHSTLQTLTSAVQTHITTTCAAAIMHPDEWLAQRRALSREKQRLQISCLNACQFEGSWVIET